MRGPAGRGLAAAGVAAALLALGPGRAPAETLLLRDGKLTGKVVLEFADVLLVAVDGGAVRFVARAEVEGLLDADGQRAELPARGGLARDGGPTPVAAVSGASGEVWVVPAGRPVGAPIGQGVALVARGETVRTGEDGLARVVLVSNASARLAPATEAVATSEAGRERLELVAGELVLDADLRPVELRLPKGVAARVEAGARLLVRQEAGATHLLLHDGQAELAWSDLRATLAPGQGAELVALGPGRWRLSADRANTGPVLLRDAEGRRELAPGASFAVGAQTDAVGELWRVVRSSGGLALRRSGAGAFVPVVGPSWDRLTLGPGDAVATSPGGQAVLGRVDGAAATLGPGAALVVGHAGEGPAAAAGGRALRVERGEVTVEAGEAPVGVETPGGTAAVRLCVARFVAGGPGPGPVDAPAPGGDAGDAPAAGEGAGEGDAAGAPAEGDGAPGLQAAAISGAVELPLGRAAVLTLEGGGVVILGGRPEDGRLELLRGAGRVASRAAGGVADARFQLALVAGDRLRLEERPGSDGPVPTLLLPGRRAVGFHGGGVGATLDIAAGRVAFESGARVALVEGLTLGLARAAERPELRFKDGPRVRLDAPLDLRVHNPTLDLLGADGAPVATVALEGELEVRLDGGGAPGSGGAPALALGLRGGDRLEVPAGAQARLERRDDQARLDLGDGRRVWVRDDAPPVQARLGAAAGPVFLTMPGVPGLAMPPGRRLTVLANAEGFVIVAEDAYDAALTGLSGLGAEVAPALEVARDRARDLLDVPPPDSPSGP